MTELAIQIVDLFLQFRDLRAITLIPFDLHVPNGAASPAVASGGRPTSTIGGDAAGSSDRAGEISS